MGAPVPHKIEPPFLVREQGITVWIRNPTSVHQWLHIEVYEDKVKKIDILLGVDPYATRAHALTWDDLKVLSLDKAISIAGVVYDAPTLPYLGEPTIISSSSAKIKFIDEKGLPVPYAHMCLADLQSGTVLKLVSDKDGVFHIPSRIAPTHGTWLVEMMKVDYGRGLIIGAYLSDYDFTDRTVQATWVNRFFVEFEIRNIDGATLETLVKHIRDFMPYPLKTVTNTLAGMVGWTENRLVNMALHWLAFQASLQSGAQMTSLAYDPEKKIVKGVIAVSALASPFVISAGAVLAFLWKMLKVVFAGALIYLVVTGLPRVVDLLIEREKTAQLTAQKESIELIEEGIKEGIITKEAGSEAIKNITEATTHMSKSTPATLLERIAVPGLAAVGGAVIGGLLVRRVMPPR